MIACNKAPTGNDNNDVNNTVTFNTKFTGIWAELPEILLLFPPDSSPMYCTLYTYDSIFIDSSGNFFRTSVSGDTGCHLTHFQTKGKLSPINDTICLYHVDSISQDSIKPYVFSAWGIAGQFHIKYRSDSLYTCFCFEDCDSLCSVDCIDCWGARWMRTDDFTTP
jgi:hypothetical protein